MRSSSYYTDEDCSGRPIELYITDVSVDECESSSFESRGSTGNDMQYIGVSCFEDHYAFAAQEFKGASYLVQNVFSDSCSAFRWAVAYEVGPCKPVTFETMSHTISAVDGGSLIKRTFSGTTTCSGSPSMIDQIDSQAVSTHSCFANSTYYYFEAADSSSNSQVSSSSVATDTSADMASDATIVDTNSGAGSTGGNTSAPNGSSSGAIIGIMVGCIVAVLVIAALVVWRRRRSRSKDDTTCFNEHLSPTNGHDADSINPNRAYAAAAAAPQSLNGLWTDEVIAAARIPRAQVKMLQLISRGGYGEVYRGTYNGDVVAVKTLLPETRKSVKHVSAFLAEVKMMAVMDHPRIVCFMGVAWDALTDLCVVSEFMAGGDLRGLLSRFDEQGHAVGFDRTKVSIAFHKAHALTYLHSLSPAVIHRDLKSKNILLSPDLDAKLTDFGISREREDRTMTAGVGTSLWMAPEVMLGERYDDKADMFSFGVVLSELDTQVLPYAHAKENNNYGHRIPDTAILQLMTMGSLRVRFSPGSLVSVVELGLACVSMNPKNRPSAADVLGKPQAVLKSEV